MSTKHNTNNKNMQKLPTITIVVTGKNENDFQKTIKSIEKQKGFNVNIVRNKTSVPEFFNSMDKDSEYYGFVSAGDEFSKDCLKEIVSKFSSSQFIGGVYSDITVRGNESIVDFYMPPHDQQGFASLLACFPFFITNKVAEIDMDENLKNLYGQNILFKASMKYIINHIPKSLFTLKHREIDLESDMEYIRAKN